MRSSLRTKIATTMWFLTALSTIMAAVVSGSLLIRSHRESIREQLQATATTLLSLGLSNLSQLNDFDQFDAFIEEALQMGKVERIVRIYDDRRALIYTTIGFDYDILPDRLDDRIVAPCFITVRGQHRAYESLVVPYAIGDAKDRHTVFLQVAIPLPRYAEILKIVWWQSALLFGVLIGCSWLLAQWLAARLLRPVKDIADYLQQLDPERIEEGRALAPHVQGEYLGVITAGIGALTARTRAAVTQLRKMGRYVAHELRTPLTILRGEAETVLAKVDGSQAEYAAVLRSSLEEIDRMSAIVTRVLELGERRTVDAATLTTIDVAQWVQENLPLWEKTLGRSIAVAVPSTTMRVTTDPLLLFRLVDNCIRNVAKHAVGSACCIRVARVSDAIIIQVDDDGPGLSPALLAGLNQTGVMPDDMGIGLHLCKRIAEMLHLRLQFANRPEGGLRVTLYTAPHRG